MSFLGKIKRAFTKSNKTHVGGFSVGGGTIVDEMPEAPKLTEAEIKSEQEKRNSDAYAQKNYGGNGLRW